MSLRELSLFSGAGGGLLATHHLLGWTTLGYVEFDDYCQRVLRARIDDGLLDAAPIFTDVREFIDSGAVDEYRGLVDVVTGGFPCQPFSAAGKGLAEADERNMWPATIECIRRIRPRYAFLENVPGLLAKPYFGTILADLAASGYRVRWDCLSASAAGANHQRDRLWIVAACGGFSDTSNDGIREQRQRNGEQRRESGPSKSGDDGPATDVADAAQCADEQGIARPVERTVSQRNGGGYEEMAESQSIGCGTRRAGRVTAHGERIRNTEGTALADADRRRCQGERRRWLLNDERTSRRRHIDRRSGEGIRDTAEPRVSERQHEALGGSSQSRALMQPQRSDWWEAEPAVGRVVDEMAHRVGQLRALGNGQVPAVAALAWQRLSQADG